MKGQEESIASVVKRASEFPDDTGKGGANVTLPQLFPDVQYPIPPGEKIINDEPPPGMSRPEGVPQYNLRAHFQRFIMGQQIVGGSKEEGYQYEERDDSVAYEELMNRILAGEAMLRWEERKTLNDGTMVISVSYFTPLNKVKKETSSEEHAS